LVPHTPNPFWHWFGAIQKIGKVTRDTGTTFFVCSGDAGATNSGGDRNGFW